MRHTVFAVLLIFFLCDVQGLGFHWPKWGKCPDLKVKQNFNIEKYMGRWYSQSTYNVDLVQGKGKCTSALYHYDSSQGQVDVFNKQIDLNKDEWVSINGTAVPVDPSKDEGKFTVTFHIASRFKVTGPYWVLGTDYSTYSVVYGCESFFGIFHYYSSWLLSRTKNLNSKASTRFYSRTIAVLKAHNIDPATFEKTDQKNCTL